MANEINFPYTQGLTLEAGIYAPGWVQQGSNIAMTEVGAPSGLYTASVPGVPAIAFGEYNVVIEDAGAANKVVGSGILQWDGTAEIVFVQDEPLTSGETIDEALSRLDNIDAQVVANGAAIAALNDISVADILAAVLAGSGESVDTALSRLDNIDADAAAANAQSAANGAAIAALNDIAVSDILNALLASGETVNVALSRLDNIDLAVTTGIPALIASLNDISVADILAAVLGSGESVDVALSRLDNIDADVAATLLQSAANGVAIAALNDIAVADILSAIVGSGDTVDQALSKTETLRQIIQGGRDIDFIGSDALGWQRIERDIAGALIQRYNLFDEGGARITGSVAAFVSAGKMIAAEVAI